MLSARFVRNKVHVNPLVADMFMPYKRVCLDCIHGENPGPRTRMRGNNMVYLFNFDPNPQDLAPDESIFEKLIHEIAHGVEIPMARFGYLHWGFNIGFPSNGKRIWAFERELMVAAIQQRLHLYFGEEFSKDDVFRSLFSLGTLKFTWDKFQGLNLKESERSARFDDLVSLSLEIIDRRLPSTDFLLKKWHRRCQALDRFPSKIKPFNRMTQHVFSAVDPFDEELRNDLRSHGIRA